MDFIDTASDAELVRSIQMTPPGSPASQDAIGALYDRHQPRIYRYLYLRVADPCQAEDLTGDVFTRMVAHLPGYQSRDLPFQAWLYRIARNLVIDLHRKQHGLAWVQLNEVEELPMEEADPQASLEQGQEIEAVRQALEMIDTLQREVVILRFLVGLPLKEVAQILDKTIPAVKSAQFRGLLALRRILSQPPRAGGAALRTPTNLLADPISGEQ